MAAANNAPEAAQGDAAKKKEDDKKKRNELAKHESTINKGLHTFYEVGKALLTIRDEELYTVTKYDTFADYCKGKFGIGYSHSMRLIDSSVVYHVLKTSPIGDDGKVLSNEELPKEELPKKESQVRPLVKLKKEEEKPEQDEQSQLDKEKVKVDPIEKESAKYDREKIAKVWGTARKEASDSKKQITAKVVKQAITEVDPSFKEMLENVAAFKTNLKQVAAMLRYAKNLSDGEAGDNPLQVLLESQKNAQDEIKKILDKRKKKNEDKEPLSTLQDAKEVLTKFAGDLGMSIEETPSSESDDSEKTIELTIQGCKITISRTRVELMKIPEPEGDTDTTDSPKDE